MEWKDKKGFSKIAAVIILGISGFFLLIILLALIGAMSSSNEEDTQELVDYVNSQQTPTTSALTGAVAYEYDSSDLQEMDEDELIDVCTELCIDISNKDAPIVEDNCWGTCQSSYYYGGEESIISVINRYQEKVSLREGVESGFYENEINACISEGWTEEQCVDYLISNGVDELNKKTEDLKAQNEKNTQIQELIEYCLPILTEAYTLKEQWISSEYQNLGWLADQQIQSAERNAQTDCENRAKNGVEYGNIDQAKQGMLLYLEQQKEEDETLRAAGRIK